MFSNIFTSVVQKLSGLNPIKTFIKYALDKFLNQLINNQIRLQDFKNGCLNLAQIGFNVDNVNTKHLVSSPYIMHSGSIGNLKIQLPNLAQVVTKSIQIQVKEILIQLKPNKDFYQNFSQKLKQLQQNSLFDMDQNNEDQQLSQNNPMDFFKQTLKKILLNIKIKVENIVVKVYMNNPEQQQKKNPFYLLIRIPKINVHKNNDSKPSKSNNVQQLKLDIEMPQLTIHLMNSKSSIPEFKNEQFKQADFPFLYPTVYHPNTILLFGLNQFDNLNIESDKSIPRLTISVVTDNKSQKRDIKIQAITSKIQVMADPLQIKIVSRFFNQIKQFKNIFGFVKNQFIQEKNKSVQMPGYKRNKSSQHKQDDTFVSICMFKDQEHGKSKKASNIIDRVIKQSSDLQKSVSQFNKEFKKELEQKNALNNVTQQMTSQLRIFNYQKRLQIILQVNSAYIYLLKKVPEQKYYRKWMNISHDLRINKSISTPYFMFSLQSLKFGLKQKQKSISLSISKVKLDNAKIVQNKKIAHLSISQDEFMDVQSSTYFYSANKNPQFKINQFKLKQQDHYCIQQIIRISQKPTQNYLSQNLKIYNFLPKPQEPQQDNFQIYRPGFQLFINQKKSTPSLKIDIFEIAVSLNPEIVKEILDIYFPINEFSSLSEEMIPNQTFEQKQKYQIQESIKIIKNKTFFQSKYNFTNQSSVIEDYVSKKEKPSIQILIKEVNLALFECPVQNFLDLIQKLKQKQNKCQTECFCKLKRKGMYFECFGININVKNGTGNLNFKKIVSGYIELTNSKISHIKALLKLSSKRSKQELRLIIQKDDKTKTDTISVILSDFSLNLQQKQILNCIELIKSQLIIAEELFYYFNHLTSTMNALQNSISNFDKKSKKNVISNQKRLEIYVQNFHISVLKIDIHTKHIYLKNQSDQLIFKLSTFVVSIKQSAQLFLNVMKNQELCLRQHIQKVSKYPFTKDSNIILEINDSSYVYKQFDLNKKQLFFDSLSKTTGSITFDMSKKSITDQNQYGLISRQVVVSKDKFQFNKKPSIKQTSISSNSIITEQQQLKKIIINISSPIYIYANNLFRLLQKKNQIEDFTQKIKILANQIQLETRVFSKPQRKTSTDSEIQKVQEMDIKISTGKLKIDIRPSFIQKYTNSLKKSQIINKFDKQIIFSTSRSFLEIQWDNIDAFIQKRTQFSNIKGNISIKYSFLQHEERQIDTNPILINQTDLQRLGFLEIFSMKNLRFESKIQKQRLKLQTLQISYLSFQSSLSTLTYLMLHWQHFTKHNIKRNFGQTLKQQQEKFQPLQIKQNIKFTQNKKQQFDEYIEDLTDGYEKYQRKIQFKQKSQAQFVSKPITQIKLQKQSQNFKVFIKEFKIKEIKVKIYRGSDFQFVSLESINQSRARKRYKVNDNQILKYVELRLDLLSISLKISKEMETQLFSKIQNLEINFSDKKQSRSGITKWLTSNNHKGEQVIFPMLRNSNTIKLLYESNKQISCFKMNKSSFDIGFTSDIIEFVEEFKQVNARIEKSGWRKIYGSEQRIETQSQKMQDKNKLILIYIPQNRLNVRLVYKGISLLSNQNINAGEFKIHQQSNRSQRMIKYVQNWVKKLVLQNIGSLISGTTLNLVGDVIVQILKLVKFVLSCIIKNGELNEDEE